MLISCSYILVSNIKSTIVVVVVVVIVVVVEEVIVVVVVAVVVVILEFHFEDMLSIRMLIFIISKQCVTSRLRKCC